MAAGSQCCCFHVKTCATIVSIFGIIGSVLSILCVLLLWWYVPMSIILLITYIFVLVGVSKERPGYLFPAEIILGINVAISAIIILALIIIGIALPSGIVDDYVDDDNTEEDAKNIVRVAFFVLAFIVFLLSSQTIFNFIVIHRARKWLTENASTAPYPAPTYPHGYATGPPPVHVVYNSGPPPPQQGYPSQQQYSPQPQGGYPQQYNPGPEGHAPPSPQPGGYDNKAY